MTLLVAAATLFMAPPASAAPGYAAELPHVDNTTLALMIATDYWHARRVELPCHPRVVKISQAQMAAWDAGDGVHALMRAAPWACTIYEGPMAREQARVWFPPYCHAIVHEVGHLAGLPHSYGGVMRADGGGHMPWACEHPRTWAKQYVRGHRVARQACVAEPIAYTRPRRSRRASGTRSSSCMPTRASRLRRWPTG